MEIHYSCKENCSSNHLKELKVRGCGMPILKLGMSHVSRPGKDKCFAIN